VFECFIIIIIVIVIETMRVREISRKRPHVIYPIVRAYSPQHALARARIIGTYKHFYVHMYRYCTYTHIHKNIDIPTLLDERKKLRYSAAATVGGGGGGGGIGPSV